MKTSAVPSETSPSEWRMRVNLAAFYRLAAHYGFDDFIYNHISARCPDNAEHYLVNAFGLMFDEVCASNLLKLDLNGRMQAPFEPDAEYNPAVPGLHGALLAGRPDLNCFAHVHTAEGMAVSAMSCGLLPLNQTAMGLVGRIAYVDYDVAWNCARLVEAVGGKDIIILRHHGLMAGGRTIAEAFLNTYNLVYACRAQVMAMAAGALAQPPSEAVVAHHLSKDRSAWLRRAGGIDADGQSVEWRAALRMLDRYDASYRE